MSSPTGLTEESILSNLRVTKDRFKLLEMPELHTIAKVEASLLRGARVYFYEKGFLEIVAPHLTKATGACENIDTMFRLAYFDKKAYLTQTAQLYLEVLTPFLEKVWCCGPSFRAERKVDSRHLTEFTLIEMELRGNLNELLQHVENLISAMVGEVTENLEEELLVLGINVERLKKLRTPFPRITYMQAAKLLGGIGLEMSNGDDLRAVHEKALSQVFNERPLFITHFPKEIKFFNMKTNLQNPKLVNSADLILPFSGEAVGAAEREYEYSKLYERLLESNMLKQLVENGGSIHDFDWYFDFYKKHGGVPHAGCGVGLNRVTQFVLGSEDIRTTTIFPLNGTSLI